MAMPVEEVCRRVAVSARRVAPSIKVLSKLTQIGVNFVEEKFSALDSTLGMPIRLRVIWRGELMNDVLGAAPFIERASKLRASVSADVKGKA